jgi:thiol-disulfide isomerase/thioredoxin
MSPRRRWILGGVGAVGALAGVGGALWREQTTAPPDEELWSLRFDTPRGGSLKLADYRGQRLLINFWATWCPPCVRELPLLDQFHREHNASGWQVVGLAVDASSAVREFLTRLPLGFPIGMAGLEGIALSRRLGNPAGGLPFSVAFDVDGRLRERHLGELSQATLQQWLRALA